MRLPSLRNTDGDDVDPVPFVVVSGLAFMVLLSFGPLYGIAYGVPLWAAIAVSTLAFLAVSVGAYRWFVRDARPGIADEAPLTGQIAFLVYLAIVVFVLVVALTLPLLLGPF